MAHPDANPTALSRRNAAALTAALLALPTAAACFLARQPDEPIDEVYALLEAHAAATRAYKAAGDRVEEIELAAVAAGHRVEYYLPQDFERLFGAEPASEQARIRAGDAWTSARGMEEAVRANDAALERVQAAELAVITATPATLAGLAAVLRWHHSRQPAPNALGQLEPLEAADYQVYLTLAAAVEGLA